MPPKTFTISAELASSIHRYLLTRPMQEVRGLVEQLEALAPVIPEQKESE